MPKQAVKAIGNIYYEARLEASEFKDCKNREVAAEQVGIERRRLLAIENNKKDPYPEEVVRMAEFYQAPYLIEDFCKNKCPIGEILFDKKTISGDIFKASVMTVASMENLKGAINILLEALKDGVLTKEEIEQVDGCMDVLGEFMDNLLNLKISYKKEKYKVKR